MEETDLNELGKYLREKECPDIYHNIILIEDTLDALAGKWKIPILFAILKGNSRFSEILTFCQGISDKVLNSRLKDLIDNRLIEKVGNEYVMTEHGISLYRVMEELWNWGARHRHIMLG